MDYKDLITSENFGVYADIPRTKLTEEEKSSTPYAKFFDLSVPVPSEENITTLLPGKAIDPLAAMLPEEISQLFAPGYLECENGYCMLSQGFGFSAVRIDMPDVQPEMMKFWFPWYTSNTVHYRTWLPDMHVEMCHEEQGHSAIENLGWGAKRVVLGRSKPFSPQDFGVEYPLESDPDFVMLLGGVNPVYDPGSDYYRGGTAKYQHFGQLFPTQRNRYGTPDPQLDRRDVQGWSVHIRRTAGSGPTCRKGAVEGLSSCVGMEPYGGIASRNLSICKRKQADLIPSVPIWSYSGSRIAAAF